MISVNVLYWAVIVFILLDFVRSSVLAYLNAKASSNPVPKVLEGLYEKEKYEKQQAYFSESTRFGVISKGLDTIISVIFFATGLFGWLSGVLQGWTSSIALQTFLFMLIVNVVSEIISIPISVYSTFVIEEKYGFNKTTKKTFAFDTIKSVLLDAVISGGMMTALAAIYTWIPDYFWIVGFAVMATFSVVFSYIYSDVIVPLFNKQTPLPEGELRDAIMEFSSKAGFKLSNIYVIDGSKRSTHSNAYFTGFGKRKRIVLYDTLIDKMPVDEIVAVLAHEIGHYKKGHIYKGMATGLVQTLILMYVMGLVLSSDNLAMAAGADGAVFYINMLVFTMLMSPIMDIAGIFGNISSRKHEVQADSFACSFGLGKSLSSALKNLARENLSNLTPHPLVVFLNYSHPPLADRVTLCEGWSDSES